MASETTRRDFLRDGAATTASLVAVGAAQAAVEPAKQPQGTKHDHQHDHRDYPRDHAGSGGPVGTGSDRGKLVPGLRPTNEPPVPVVTPDLLKLPWKMVN